MKRWLSYLILFLFAHVAHGQEVDSTYQLTGTVVNNLQQPLEGAHIIVNRKIGYHTNELGEFKINVRSNDTVLVTFIGYQQFEYVAPHRKKGNYLTKFTLAKDSINLPEVEVFPYPTYEEFKEAFLELDKSEEEIILPGVKQYKGEIRDYVQPSPMSPISFMYDRLFDQKAKQQRKLKRRRKTILKSMDED